MPLINLLITEESSVAYEALLLDIPTISVNDWKIQRHKHSIRDLLNLQTFVLELQESKNKDSRYNQKKKLSRYS